MTSNRLAILKYFISIIFVASFSFSFFPIYANAAGLVPCGGIADDGTQEHKCEFDDIVIVAKNVIKFLIITVGVPLSVIVFIYAGIILVTQGSNPSSRQKAKTMFLNVFLGLVIALSAWLVVNFIIESFGVRDNVPGAVLLGK